MQRAIFSIFISFLIGAGTDGFAPKHRRRPASHPPAQISLRLPAGERARIVRSIHPDLSRVATRGGRRRRSGASFLLRAAAEDSDSDDAPSAEATSADAAVDVDVDVEVDGDASSIFGRLRAVFKKKDDGLTSRERLRKMGLSALLSYGFVSNMSYAVTLTLAWYGFSKKTGLSPLAPGQWKPFLAVYAGFYVFNNIVRPIRLAASVVVAKYFDNLVDFVEGRTGFSRKWSIATVVFFANVCGTFAAMGGGVAMAAAAAGVPVFPSKV